MQIGISGATFGLEHPLDQDILVAAVNGFAFLDILVPKLEGYLAQPDFDIRDLTRLFLRTKPGALDDLDGLRLDQPPDVLEAHLTKRCQEVRRVGAGVLILRPQASPLSPMTMPQLLALVAQVAQRWSVRVAIAPGTAPDLATIPQTWAAIHGADSAGLGLLLDTVALHATGGDASTIAALSPQAIAHIHLADSRPGNNLRLPPGAGTLPLVADIQALAQVAPTVPLTLTLSPQGEQPPAAVARAAQESVRQLLLQAGIGTEDPTQ